MKVLAPAGEPTVVIVFVPGPTSVRRGSAGWSAWYIAVTSKDAIALFFPPVKASIETRTGEFAGWTEETVWPENVDCPTS